MDRRAILQSRPLGHGRRHRDAADHARPERDEPARQVVEAGGGRVRRDPEEIGGAR
jgi:hypothetical protein